MKNSISTLVTVQQKSEDFVNKSLPFIYWIVLKRPLQSLNDSLLLLCSKPPNIISGQGLKHIFRIFITENRTTVSIMSYSPLTVTQNVIVLRVKERIFLKYIYLKSIVLLSWELNPCSSEESGAPSALRLKKTLISSL